jgi:hypothetical protein
MAKLLRVMGATLLVALAFAVGASFLLWVRGDGGGGGSGLCAADVPVDVPPGLTWAVTDWLSYHDADICITTKGSSVRRLYHWQGKALPKLAWSPDGGTLQVRKGDESAEFVTASGEIQGRREPVTEWFTRDRGVGECGPGWGVCSYPSPDGSFVAVYTLYGIAGGDAGLYIGPSEPEATLRYITDNGKVPRWSPDSRWVAFEKPPGGITSDPYSVFVVRPDGSSLTKVAANAGSPVWRPSDD